MHHRTRQWCFWRAWPRWAFYICGCMYHRRSVRLMGPLHNPKHQCKHVQSHQEQPSVAVAWCISTSHWHLQAVGAPLAWRPFTEAGVCVAMHALLCVCAVCAGKPPFITVPLNPSFFLQELVDEQQPLLVTPDNLDRFIVSRLIESPPEQYPQQPFHYLLGCYHRAAAEQRSLGQDAAGQQLRATVDACKQLLVSYAGLVLMSAGVVPEVGRLSRFCWWVS